MTLYSNIGGARSIIKAGPFDRRLERRLRLIALLLFLLFINLPHDISPFIIKALLGHYVIVCPFDTYRCAFLSCGNLLRLRFAKRVSPLWRQSHPPVESSLMILVLTIVDLLVAEILHGVFLRPTELHFLDEIFLPGDAGESLILPIHGVLVLGVIRLIRYVVEELRLVILVPVDLCNEATLT